MICSAIGMQSNIELHPKCEGCIEITKLDQCSKYLEPMRQWTRIGGCPGKPKEQVEGKPKSWIDPIKASKRGLEQK